MQIKTPDYWMSERRIAEYRRVSDNQEHAEQLIASEEVDAALKMIASNDELASQMLAEVAACPKVGVPNAKLVRTLLARDPQVPSQQRVPVAQWQRR